MFKEFKGSKLQNFFKMFSEKTCTINNYSSLDEQTGYSNHANYYHFYLLHQFSDIYKIIRVYNI